MPKETATVNESTRERWIEQEPLKAGVPLSDIPREELGSASETPFEYPGWDVAAIEGHAYD